MDTCMTHCRTSARSCRASRFPGRHEEVLLLDTSAWCFYVLVFIPSEGADIRAIIALAGSVDFCLGGADSYSASRGGGVDSRRRSGDGTQSDNRARDPCTPRTAGRVFPGG